MTQTIGLQLLQTFRRASKLALAVIASVLVTTAVYAGTANAAYWDCNYNGGDYQIACFWYDINYNGLRTDYYSPSVSVCHNFSSTFNDQISSLYNRTSHYLLLFHDANCNNSYPLYNVPPYTHQNVDGWLANDEASAFALENSPR